MSEINVQNQLRSILEPVDGANRLDTGLSKVQEAEGNGKSFVETLGDSVNEVNRLQNEASDMLQKLATGESKDVHSTVIALQKAGISFKLMMEVRNKLVEAYKEVMRSAS